MWSFSPRLAAVVEFSRHLFFLFGIGYMLTPGPSPSPPIPLFLFVCFLQLITPLQRRASCFRSKLLTRSPHFHCLIALTLGLCSPFVGFMSVCIHYNLFTDAWVYAQPVYLHYERAYDVSNDRHECSGGRAGAQNNTTDRLLFIHRVITYSQRQSIKNLRRDAHTRAHVNFALSSWCEPRWCFVTGRGPTVAVVQKRGPIPRHVLRVLL